MAWLFVLVAGLFEVAWAVGLKQTEGFTRLWPSVLTLVGMAISFVLLALAMRTLPAGTAYAVWTGIGAVGTALVGILWLGEPATCTRVGSLLLITIGIVGLKLSGE
jgi:quaternary ammonium compound-resistance protein SugE